MCRRAGRRGVGPGADDRGRRLLPEHARTGAARPRGEPPASRAGRRGQARVQGLVNPTRDLPEPDADYRSNVEGLGKPNASAEAPDATFTFGILASPTSLAHETLHLVGLDDRYSDFYRAGGQDYPLPRTGMSPSELRSWARAHKPRLAAPPSGKVIEKNLKGVDRCDVMGVGFESACRRIAQRDLDWLASQAGLQVTAEPGDLLLNKDPSRQNFGVAYRSVVLAAPGETTVAKPLETSGTADASRAPAVKRVSFRVRR